MAQINPLVNPLFDMLCFVSVILARFAVYHEHVFTKEKHEPSPRCARYLSCPARLSFQAIPL